MSEGTPFEAPGAADPRAPLPPEMRARLERAWIQPAAEPFWWQGIDHMPPDRVAACRAEALAALDRVERIHGPPSRDRMLQRLEFEARHDPRMPPWLHRPWFVAPDVMLAVDALFEASFGVGYSAFSGGNDGRCAMGTEPARRHLWLLVKPTPGAIPAGTDRDELARSIAARCAELGLPNARLSLWNDTEPAKAYLGMLCGEIIREGHKRLGIPREYSAPEDYDNY